MALENWQPKFLLKLREVFSIAAAAEAAGVTRAYVYQVRERDPEFARKWDEAKESAIDALEEKAFERARNMSDPLMQFLLKAHRPGVYKDTARVEVTGTDGNPILVAAIVADRMRIDASLAEGDGTTEEIASDIAALAIDSPGADDLPVTDPI